MNTKEKINKTIDEIVNNTQERETPWWVKLVSVLCPISGWLLWGVLHKEPEWENIAKDSALFAWLGFAIAFIYNLLTLWHI